MKIVRETEEQLFKMTVLLFLFYFCFERSNFLFSQKKQRNFI